MNTFYGNFHRILPHLHFFYSDSIASYKLNLKYFLKDGKKKSLACSLFLHASKRIIYQLLLFYRKMIECMTHKKQFLSHLFLADRFHVSKINKDFSLEAMTSVLISYFEICFAYALFSEAWP